MLASPKGNMKLIAPKLIAIVDSLALKPATPDIYTDGKDIVLRIGKLESDRETTRETPRNYSHQYEEREDTAGGQSARIWSTRWKSDPLTASFCYRGPDIHGGELREYRRALKGMEKVDRRLESMRETRGPSVDAVDSLGRWLEACGVSEVWFRPPGEERAEWLNRGEWKSETTGSFVYRVRQIVDAVINPPAPVAAEVAEA